MFGLSVVSTIAEWLAGKTQALERLVPEMTYYVLSWTLDFTYSLLECDISFIY